MRSGEILDTFLSEMHGSFQMQFEDFNDALAELKKVQKENTEYTSELYKTMSSQLSETFTKQERAMKEAIKEIDEMQSSYMKTADRIIRDNQTIQQLQKRELRKVCPAICMKMKKNLQISGKPAMHLCASMWTVLQKG